MDHELEETHIVVGRPGYGVDRCLGLVLDHEDEVHGRNGPDDPTTQAAGQKAGHAVKNTIFILSFPAFLVSVRNPLYPSSIITPLMLLTHSSGLAGPKTDEELPGFYDWFPPDAAPLNQTFMEYLLPGGPFYIPAVWKDSAPDRRELYSNLGATPLVNMIEFVSGKEFSAYCRNHIFLPLGMPGTSYKLADLDAERPAV